MSRAEFNFGNPDISIKDNADSKMLLTNKSLSHTYRRSDDVMLDRKERGRGLLSRSFVADDHDFDSLDPSYLPKIK